jgi:hypothetical protein
MQGRVSQWDGWSWRLPFCLQLDAWQGNPEEGAVRGEFQDAIEAAGEGDSGAAVTSD